MHRQYREQFWIDLTEETWRKAMIKKYFISEIHDQEKKSACARVVLESLPHWFGNKKSLEEYVIPCYIEEGAGHSMEVRADLDRNLEIIRNVMVEFYELWAEKGGRSKMNLEHITVNTQSSIRIAGSKILYFDPFKVETATHDADIIFITHKHYDHFEPESIAKIKKENTFLVAPESMKKQVLSESNVKTDQCIFYNPGETHELEGIVIETIPMYNKLKPFHPKGKKWQGYLVKMDECRYYVAGDTDVNEDIKNVKCDVALIPIGGHYTMDKKQAAEYIASLKLKAVIPTHYGSIVGKQTDGGDFERALAAMDKDIQIELRL